VKYINVTLLFSIVIFFSACAEKSGVYPAGNNTHSISNQASSGFSGMQDIRTDAYKEASQYCQNLNKNFEVISNEETKPPYILGNYPRITLTFKCI